MLCRANLIACVCVPVLCVCVSLCCVFLWVVLCVCPHPRAGGKDEAYLLELQAVGGFPFVKTKVVPTPTGYVPPQPTFLTQFGQVMLRNICSKRMYLWPDEEARATEAGAAWLGRLAQIPLTSAPEGTVNVRIARYEYGHRGLYVCVCA